MQLYVSKCKVIHFGCSNTSFDYFMKDSENLSKCLDKSKRVKDLGVTFTPDLSWKDHILEITARTNRILGSLKKAFVNRDSYHSNNMLEYAFQVWLPTKVEHRVNRKFSSEGYQNTTFYEISEL